MFGKLCVYERRLARVGGSAILIRCCPPAPFCCCLGWWPFSVVLVVADFGVGRVVVELGLTVLCVDWCFQFCVSIVSLGVWLGWFVRCLFGTSVWLGFEVVGARFDVCCGFLGWFLVVVCGIYSVWGPLVLVWFCIGVFSGCFRLLGVLFGSVWLLV